MTTIIRYFYHCADLDISCSFKAHDKETNNNSIQISDCMTDEAVSRCENVFSLKIKNIVKEIEENKLSFLFQLVVGHLFLCRMGNWIYHAISKLTKSAEPSGAQSTHQTMDSKDCLLSAVKRRDNLAVMSLLDQGCDLEAVDEDGYTALHHTCSQGHYRITKLLLDNGASVHTVHAQTGETALHLACKTPGTGIGSFRISDVAWLLKRGADVNALQMMGNTALHLAAYVGDTNASKLLLSYGADLNLENNRGETPLVCALLLSIRGAVSFFIKQLVKMKDQNLFLSERNVKELSENDKVIGFSKSCEAEIQRMKKSMIGDSNVTIYDIFTKGEHRLADFLSNKTVEQAIESEDYKANFPNYASEIHERFLQGRERRDLLRRSSELLWTVINESYELPFILVERINRCLTNDDLTLQICQEDPTPLEAERRELEAHFLEFY